MPRACIFCGATDLTREHVIPKWVSNAIRGSFDAFTLSREGGGTRPWTRNEEFIGLTARALCKNCNSGWLSAFESDVKPVLEPLLRGDFAPLSTDDQQLISAWTIKTAMTHEYCLDQVVGRFFSDDEHRQFEADYTFPPHTQVWLARRAPSKMLAGTIQRPTQVPGPDGSPGLVSTLLLGRVALQAVCARIELDPDQVEVQFVATDGWGELSTRIWPVGDAGPQLPELDDEMIDRFEKRWLDDNLQ